MSGDFKHFNPKQYKHTKFSVGIACVRKNEDINKYEILLVRKRFSYGFVDFIMGRCFSYDNSKLHKLFLSMTFKEKMDILNRSFDILMPEIFLNMNLDSYNTKRQNYERYMNRNIHNIKRIIENTKHSGLLWEIPKGRLSNDGNSVETHLECAVREFEEETNIRKSQYKLLTNKTRNYSFIEDRIRYNIKYYIAITKYDIEAYINFRNVHQTTEICDIAWYTIEQVRLLKNEQLSDLCKHIINAAKKEYKVVY